MFRFTPTVFLGRLRRTVLAATEFEPIALDPMVAKQLEYARRIDSAQRLQLDSKFQLFLYVLRGLDRLIYRIVLWVVAGALVVLGAVFITREIFEAKAPLGVGLGLTALFFFLKMVQATIDYRVTTELLQVHRGVQVSLYRIINEKLARISPAGRAEFSKGQLKTLIGSDVESIEDFLSAAVWQWTRAIVLSVVVMPVLWLNSGTPGLIALAVVLAIIPVAAVGAVFVEHFQRSAQTEQDELTTAVGEWVKNIRLVRFLGWDRGIEAEVNHRMWRYIVRAAVRHTAVLVVWALSFSWSMFPMLAIVAVSLMRETPLNLTEVFSSFWLLDHLMSQIQYIPHSLSLYGAASAGAERVKGLLIQPELNDTLVDSHDEVVAEHAQPARLILRNVRLSFGLYEAIKGISTTIDLNKRTVIIGSVGSGKSTLLELLIGEVPLTSGSIEVEFADGSRGPLWRRDIYSVFRSAVAYSPQQPFLSNASMRDNIDLSERTGQEDLECAASLAQLNDDIALFKRGVLEEVGESGINLSGGQKQRVSLARAFISKRPVWVLDDPLSAVDTQTEERLTQAICAQAQGLILVSHRVSVLDTCDRVLVLDEGTIIEDGDPKQLSRDSSSHTYRFVQAVELHGN